MIDISNCILLLFKLKFRKNLWNKLKCTLYDNLFANKTYFSFENNPSCIARFANLLNDNAFSPEIDIKSASLKNIAYAF